MSIAQELLDSENFLINAYDKLAKKGATMPEKKTLKNLAETIESLMGIEFVDYIESTGTQYIDTGIVPTSSIKVKTQVEFPTTSQQQYAVVAGTQNGENGLNAFLMFCDSNLNARTGDSGGIATNIPIETGKTYDLELKFNEYTINGTVYTASLTWKNNITGNLYLFCRGCPASSGGILANSYAKIRMKYFQIYDNDTLVRDFKPCKDTHGEYCLYDAVSGRYFYNAGTGSFRGEGWQPSYIESTGVQYIDTGYSAYKTKTEITFQFTSKGSANQYVMAAWNDNNNRYYPAQLNVGTNVINTADKSNNYTQLGSYDTNQHTVIYNDENNKVYFDGVEKATISDLDTQTTNSIFLFAVHTSSGAAQEYFIGRIMSAKITDKETNTLARDYIPAIDGEGVVCLYDKVSKTYFYNAGSGTFNCG